MLSNNFPFHRVGNMEEDAREEQDFPRGGAPILSPLEARKIRKTAQRDILFSVMTFWLLFQL